MSDHDDLIGLRAENARLIALLTSLGIEWRLPPKPSLSVSESARLSTDQKVMLFRRLFRGRTDTFPIRWESKTTGKSGYAPACANEWRAGVCETLGVPVVLEISRSGEGAHARVFFASRVPARDARRLGTAVISHTCACTRQLQLTSYDRLFPNQDTMPKGGFGNLIAMPLQKGPREKGFSVFVDAELRPYPDQWAFLASVQPMDAHDIEPTILRATGGVHPLDGTFIDDEDLATPWKRESTSTNKLAGLTPKSLSVTLANLIYFEKAHLPQALANRLIRLAAFQNPEFYKAQAMRMSVWDKPRVIGCAENYPQHIALPRGCLDAALSLLRENGIACDLRDERFGGQPLDVSFVGSLRLDQEAAIAAMLCHDAGVLCAPTAFGKTVTAAAMISRRGVNTLVLVHRTDLGRCACMPSLAPAKVWSAPSAAARPSPPARSTSP